MGPEYNTGGTISARTDHTGTPIHPDRFIHSIYLYIFLSIYQSIYQCIYLYIYPCLGTRRQGFVHGSAAPLFPDHRAEVGCAGGPVGPAVGGGGRPAGPGDRLPRLRAGGGGGGRQPDGHTDGGGEGAPDRGGVVAAPRGHEAGYTGHSTDRGHVSR